MADPLPVIGAVLRRSSNRRSFRPRIAAGWRCEDCVPDAAESDSMRHEFRTHRMTGL
ncbi:MAG: hypothetical protein IIC13_13380 [SAR324 cluster bacterium]|nr:hypothetical protein [SAR324 cluster bacterium]MCH8887571.1 hypothetical protein [SAR324 cluster bacterium]